MLEKKEDEVGEIPVNASSQPPESNPSPNQPKLATLSTPQHQSTQNLKESPTAQPNKSKRGRPAVKSLYLSEKLAKNLIKFEEEDRKAAFLAEKYDKESKKPKKSQEIVPKQAFKANKFVKILRQRGFTIDLFSEAIGINRNKIYRWVKFKNEPTLCEYFGIVCILKLETYTALVDLSFVQGQYKCTSLPKPEAFDFSRFPKVEKVSSTGNRSTRIKTTKIPLKPTTPHVFAEPPSFVPNIKPVSTQFNRFPQVSGVDFPSFIASDPSMTEKNLDGYHCTLECHMDRKYRASLHRRNPEKFSEPEKIAKRHLIRRTRKQGRFGKDIWKFVMTSEVYDWTQWDIVNGISILNQELAAGNPSVRQWHDNLVVDNAAGWRTVFYDLYEEHESEVSGFLQGLSMSAEDIAIKQDTALAEFERAERAAEQNETDDHDLSAGMFDDDEDEDIDLDIDTAEERKF